MFVRGLILSLLLTISLSGGLQVTVSSTSAVLINSKTGKVLYDKNGSQPMYPASCTKIAFALYAIHHHAPLFKKRIAASQNALKSLTEAQKSKNNFSLHPSYILEKDASHMGLKVGEEMTFYDLLEATMVVSADDASNVIAEVMGNGSIDKCVENVNRFVRSLGLESTTFKNPHGLHHPEHVTCAHDLALLSREAMKHPLFRAMAKKPRYLRPKTNKQKSVYLQSTNRLLVKGSSVYYAPAVGIKTGYHRRAGHCLVAEAEKDGRSLIAVVLQGKNRDERFHDTIRLFEAAFSEKKVSNTYLQQGAQSFSREVDGGVELLSTYTSQPIILSFYPSEEPEVRCELLWYTRAAPIEKGTAVGELLFYADGALQKKVPLFAANSVDERFFHALMNRYWPFILIGICLVGVIAFFLKKIF